MSTCEKLVFPVRETWLIDVDSAGHHKDVTCMFVDHDQVKFGLFVRATSVDDLPELIKQGKRLLKRKKAQKHPERENLYYYG